MSIFYTVLIFFFSIFLSQYIGKINLSYIKFYSFVVINTTLFILFNLTFKFNFLLINALVAISLMLAWAGLSIHISNSIVLSLLNLINNKLIKNDNDIIKSYNQKNRYLKRINALINGNYLIRNNSKLNFNFAFKNIILLKIIIYLKK